MHVIADFHESTNILQTSLSPIFFLNCPLPGLWSPYKVIHTVYIPTSGYPILGSLLEWYVVAFLLTTALNPHPRVGWWQVLPRIFHSSSDDFKTIHATTGLSIGSIPGHTCGGDKGHLIHLCVRLRFSITVVRNSTYFISASGLPCNSSFSRFENVNRNRKLTPHSLLKIWSDTYHWFISSDEPGWSFQFLRSLWCRKESLPRAPHKLLKCVCMKLLA